MSQCSFLYQLLLQINIYQEVYEICTAILHRRAINKYINPIKCKVQHHLSATVVTHVAVQIFMSVDCNRMLSVRV